MNTINLIGRLTRDPELRNTPAGKPVCAMRLAVNGARDGDVTYVDVVAFDKQAEACSTHLTKGRQIGVTGRLHYSEWEADDGSKHSKHEVIGRVQFLGGNGTPAAADADRENASEDLEIVF